MGTQPPPSTLWLCCRRKLIISIFESVYIFLRKLINTHEVISTFCEVATRVCWVVIESPRYDWIRIWSVKYLLNTNTIRFVKVQTRHEHKSYTILLVFVRHDGIKLNTCMDLYIRIGLNSKEKMVKLNYLQYIYIYI